MSKDKGLFYELKKGILIENPLFVQVLGTCPSLATTTSVENALGMGAAFTAVLVCSNIAISLIRKLVPEDIRIPSYIVVIASFVTLVEMVMNAFAQALYNSLGIFIPLIVVNCIILGIGHTLAIVVISTIREILGAGTFLGHAIPVISSQPILVMILPAGAFITMGFLFAGMNILNNRKAKAGKNEVM